MKKLIIFLLLNTLCVPLFAQTKQCKASFGKSPVDPTNTTHYRFNNRDLGFWSSDYSKQWDVFVNGIDKMPIPYAFATEDFKHILIVDDYLNSYTCFDQDKSENTCGVWNSFKFSDDVVAILKNNRIVDFYICHIGTDKYSHSFSTKNSGWRRIEDKLKEVKQCSTSNLFKIDKSPKSNGGKAYYFLDVGDGQSYSYESGNNIFYSSDIDEEKLCYYYYCDNGYIYFPDMNDCKELNLIFDKLSQIEEDLSKTTDLKPERKRQFKVVLDKLEKNLDNDRNLTPEQKTAYKSKIQTIKQQLDLE